MTTSDDEPVIQQDPATADDLAATTHAELMEEAMLDESLAAPPESGGLKQWLLAAVVCVLALVVGAALWAGIYDWRNQEYVGVSVVIALMVGPALRLITKRSDKVVQIVAVLVTLAGIVLGTIVGAAWFASTIELPFGADPGGFFEVLPEVAPNWWDIRTDPDAGKVQYLILAASLVLAYLSAGPQSGGKKKGEPEPVPLADIVHDPLADPLAEPETDELDETTEDDEKS